MSQNINDFKFKLDDREYSFADIIKTPYRFITEGSALDMIKVGTMCDGKISALFVKGFYSSAPAMFPTSVLEDNFIKKTVDGIILIDMTKVDEKELERKLNKLKSEYGKWN